MAIFESREQLAQRMQSLIGDRTDDEALNFIQDALETYDSRPAASEGSISNEEHTRLMEEQDTAWRKRYRDTFFGTPDPNIAGNSSKFSKSDPAGSAPGSSENNPANYDDLFK